MASAMVFAVATTTFSPADAASKARFKATLDPASVSVVRGSTSNVTVLVTRYGTFSGPIKLSSSTRKGLAITFDENPLVGDDTDLFIAADTTAAIGSTTLTVSASDGKTTAKLRLKVKVTAGVAGAASTTTPVTTTIAPTSSTSTSTSTSIVASTSTSTSTTTTLKFSGSAKVSASVGNVVIRRKVSQDKVCAKPASVAVTITISLQNTGTSDRLLTSVAPGTCTETNSVPIVPGGLVAAKVPVGSLIVARSRNTAGNPIRTVIYVKDAGNFDVSGSMRVAYTCTGVNDALPLTMADGDQVVINAPAGSSCRVFTVDSNPNSVTDNSGLPLDGTAQVPGLPASCVIATPTTPIPGPEGCYAEFTVTT